MRFHRLRARHLRGHFGLALAAALAWAPTGARATALTESDFTLSVSASQGSSWLALDASTLTGFFNSHRCLCPDTLTPTLQLTSSGQTNMSTSTVGVAFFLGAACATSSASCVSLGSATFTASKSATPPTFDSGQVFKAAAGNSAVDCASLVAGSTTLWAILTQDGVALPFTLALALPVTATVVAAPTAVTALPADQGLLVSWTPPADRSQVSGYQVLCLPRPAQASPAAYESCGLPSVGTDTTIITAADQSQVCSGKVSAATTSVRLSGLENGTSYTVAVIAIDQGGGISALSPPAVAIPQPTIGFFEKYKQDCGGANACTLSPHSGHAGPFWMALVGALVVALGRGRRRNRRRATRVTRALVLLLAWSATARAQDSPNRRSANWAWDSPTAPVFQPPDWGLEIGVSLYRPAVDGEFSYEAHPFADTFSSSRHLMSELELDRYLARRFGTWGVGLRGGYYQVTGAAFLADGITRSGDKTALRLIPFSLSTLYRADRIPHLKNVPLVPYLKAGLDGVVWTGSRTGNSPSHTGFTPGWHGAAGVALGLNFLGMGSLNPGALADPCALFFEWDYAVINGLGLGHKLHVGDSTWFAGVMIEL
jgi:hypothetical protein